VLKVYHASALAERLIALAWDLTPQLGYAVASRNSLHALS